MTYRLLATTLFVSALALPIGAHAETSSSSAPKMKTVTTLVGYEETMLGNIIIEGSGYDETQIPEEIDPASAFDILDKDGDMKISKTEMFEKSNQPKTTSRKGTKLVTRTGNPVRVDYYVHSNAPSTVRVEDLTPDGSMFEQMDMNKDMYITRDEFRFDIPAQGIAPAAGDSGEDMAQ